MYDYLRENFDLYSLGNLCVLKKTTIISQLLVSENREYKENFIKNNLVDNFDGLAEISGIDKLSKKCPNIYPSDDVYSLDL